MLSFCVFLLRKPFDFSFSLRYKGVGDTLQNGKIDDVLAYLENLYHFAWCRSRVLFCSYFLILSWIGGDFKPHLLRHFHKFFFRKIGSPLSTKKTSRANHLGNLVWNFISSKMSRKMGLKQMTSAQKPWIWKNIHKPKLNKISAGNELHSMIRKNIKRNWYPLWRLEYSLA